MTKKALITGITGQDGSYLAELLLSKDYEVQVSCADQALSTLTELITFTQTLMIQKIDFFSITAT